jgi:hypothetical protein
MAEDVVVHGLPRGTYPCRCPSGKVRIFLKPCKELSKKELEAGCRGSSTLRVGEKTLNFKFSPRDDDSFDAEVSEDED